MSVATLKMKSVDQSTKLTFREHFILARPGSKHIAWLISLTFLLALDPAYERDAISIPT